MKLLKKLLPVAAIASTAAVVAPIVTSCGAGTITFDVYKEDGTMNEYTPVVEQHAAVTTPLSNADGLKEYLTCLNNDKRIIADDYLASRFMKFSISDEPKVTHKEKLQITTKSVNLEEKRVNVVCKMDSIHKIEDTDNKTTTEITSSFTVTYTNIEMYAAYVAGAWGITHNYGSPKAMKDDAKWSVTVKGTTKTVETTEIGSDVETSKTDYKADANASDDIIKAVGQYLNYLTFDSHFFAKVTGTGE